MHTVEVKNEAELTLTREQLCKALGDIIKYSAKHIGLAPSDCISGPIGEARRTLSIVKAAPKFVIGYDEEMKARMNK